MDCHYCDSPLAVPLFINDLPFCPRCWVRILERWGWPELRVVLANIAQHAPLDTDTFQALLRAWLPMIPLAPVFAPLTTGALTKRVSQACDM